MPTDVQHLPINPLSHPPPPPAPAPGTLKSQILDRLHSYSIPASPSLSAPSTSRPLSSAGVRCTTAIFDLGDVLFTWTPPVTTAPATSSSTPLLSPQALRQILRSLPWFAHETGHLSESQAYASVATMFSVPETSVAATFAAARASLRPDPKMIDFIRDLKQKHGVRCYAMSNISAADWEFLRSRIEESDWLLFERVFVSAEVGKRKPDVGFYRHVVREIGETQGGVVFVDDKAENVLSGRSVGWRGVVFDGDGERARREVLEACSMPRRGIQRARAWLKDHAQRMHSVTGSGEELKENFAQLLILEATGGDEELVQLDYGHRPGLWNFFAASEGGLAAKAFPEDLDTTSLGLTIAPGTTDETMKKVMDEIVKKWINEDGIVVTYFDASRPRIDPVVCVNVLTLFHTHKRGHELASTLDWVYDVLQHRAYLQGTLYYDGGDTFLFFLSRLLGVASEEVQTRFDPVFKECVRDRIGVEGDTLALALRVLAGLAVGVVNRVDGQRLVELQQEDGAWQIGWLYKFGSTGKLIGNQGLTTALAVRAVEAMGEYPR